MTRLVDSITNKVAKGKKLLPHERAFFGLAMTYFPYLTNETKEFRPKELWLSPNSLHVDRRWLIHIVKLQDVIDYFNRVLKDHLDEPIPHVINSSGAGMRLHLDEVRARVENARPGDYSVTPRELRQKLKTFEKLREKVVVYRHYDSFFKDWAPKYSNFKYHILQLLIRFHQKKIIQIAPDKNAPNTKRTKRILGKLAKIAVSNDIDLTKVIRSQLNNYQDPKSRPASMGGVLDFTRSKKRFSGLVDLLKYEKKTVLFKFYANLTGDMLKAVKVEPPNLHFVLHSLSLLMNSDKQIFGRKIKDLVSNNMQKLFDILLTRLEPNDFDVLLNWMEGIWGTNSGHVDKRAFATVVRDMFSMQIRRWEHFDDFKRHLLDQGKGSYVYRYLKTSEVDFADKQILSVIEKIKLKMKQRRDVTSELHGLGKNVGRDYNPNSPSHLSFDIQHASKSVRAELVETYLQAMKYMCLSKVGCSDLLKDLFGHSSFSFLQSNRVPEIVDFTFQMISRLGDLFDTESFKNKIRVEDLTSFARTYFKYVSALVHSKNDLGGARIQAYYGMFERLPDFLSVLRPIDATALSVEHENLSGTGALLKEARSRILNLFQKESEHDHRRGRLLSLMVEKWGTLHGGSFMTEAYRLLRCVSKTR